MAAPLPVLVNIGGGTAAAHGEGLGSQIEAAFAAVDQPIALRLVEGGDLAAAVARLADRSAIVVGGGDGTLGAAAQALHAGGSQAVLGILPLGTHNHLARDLGIPQDLAEAARVAAFGAVTRIDMGQVNGRLFLNNASLGLYPALVQRREAVRRARGLGPKWLADVPAAWGVLRRARHHRLRLLLDGERKALRTPMLFVGNNRYLLQPGRLGQRESLSDGRLSVLALKHSSRAGLVRLALRTLLGRTEPSRDHAAVAETPAFEVQLHGDEIEIALDGEVTRLEGPLRFSILRHALAVRAPSP